METQVREGEEFDSAEQVDEEIAVDYGVSGEEGGEELDVDDPFFVTRQAAAVFKHELLKSYFPKFAGKAASNEAGRRLVYVDTHAGCGQYVDGTPGSPLLIAQSVKGMAARRIDCFFIEKNRSNFRSLQRVLREAMPTDSAWEVRRGAADTHLSEAVSFAGNSPLFVFIDPYGLGPNFETVVSILKRPRVGFSRKTEVLLNFISSAFARAGGYLAHDMPSPQEVRTLNHLDAVLCGAWWRDIYRSANPKSEAVAEIAALYAARISEATGCQWTLIPVFSRARHSAPIYWLLHFTYHPDGAWWIREAAALAASKWRRHLSPPPEPDDNALFQIGDRFPEEEQRRQARWVDEIEVHARRTLAATGQINVRSDVRQLFGDLFGVAWAKHLRQALLRLYEEGALIPRPASKGFENYVGSRTGSRSGISS